MKKLKNIDKRPYSGIYKPLNPQKYKGNVNNIIYRSSWEKRFMMYCDKNRSVLEWGSEEIAISYRSVDNRPHRYYPDFYMKVRKSDGSYQKFIVEIKPKKQTRKPKAPLRITRTYKNALITYERNRRKWSTAYAWCHKRNMKFLILTEDHLKTFYAENCISNSSSSLFDFFRLNSLLTNLKFEMSFEPCLLKGTM